MPIVSANDRNAWPVVGNRGDQDALRAVGFDCEIHTANSRELKSVARNFRKSGREAGLFNVVEPGQFRDGVSALANKNNVRVVFDTNDDD